MDVAVLMPSCDEIVQGGIREQPQREAEPSSSDFAEILESAEVGLNQTGTNETKQAESETPEPGSTAEAIGSPILALAAQPPAAPAEAGPSTAQEAALGAIEDADAAEPASESGAETIRKPAGRFPIRESALTPPPGAKTGQPKANPSAERGETDSRPVSRAEVAPPAAPPQRGDHQPSLDRAELKRPMEHPGQPGDEEPPTPKAEPGPKAVGSEPSPILRLRVQETGERRAEEPTRTEVGPKAERVTTPAPPVVQDDDATVWVRAASVEPKGGEPVRDAAPKPAPAGDAKAAQPDAAPRGSNAETPSQPSGEGVTQSRAAPGESLLSADGAQVKIDPAEPERSPEVQAEPHRSKTERTEAQPEAEGQDEPRQVPPRVPASHSQPGEPKPAAPRADPRAEAVGSRPPEPQAAMGGPRPKPAQEATEPSATSTHRQPRAEGEIAPEPLAAKVRLEPAPDLAGAAAQHTAAAVDAGQKAGELKLADQTSTASAGAPEPVRQVAQAVQRMVVDPKKQTAEIRLVPEHLGRLRLEVEVCGDKVKVAAVASTPHAQTALNSGSATLRESLQDLGYTLESFDARFDQNAQRQTNQPGHFVPGLTAISKPGAESQQHDRAIAQIRDPERLLDLFV
jgi:flagellar hook-length control protein FliK